MQPTCQREVPESIAEACELVRRAGRNGTRIVAAGSGSKRSWTSAPTGSCVELDMRRLNRVVEYSPADMTITVEAGMTLGSLQALLQEHNQRVTLDPPRAEQATIGGILASNDSGPIRFAFGTARDVVIGMSMIEADGELIKSGGKVVKNVAGYDLHKLYIGSFGTMGPIATATFKLRPLPERRGLVVLTPRDPVEAEDLLGEILAGDTRPTLIELLNERMAAAVKLLGRLTLVVGFEDNAEAVAWQSAALIEKFGGVPLGATDSQRIYENLREAAGATAETSFKATVLSSRTAEFFGEVGDLPIRMIARAGNGIIHGLLEEPIGESSWLQLESAAVEGSGGLQVRGRPPAFLPRFGRRRSDAELSEAIQRAFDPKGIFAPERLA